MAKHRQLILAMLDRDTTQIEISKKSGINESRLSRIINGHDEPSVDEKKALAKALRQPINDLFPESAVAS